MRASPMAKFPKSEAKRFRKATQRLTLIGSEITTAWHLIEYGLHRLERHEGTGLHKILRSEQVKELKRVFESKRS